MGTRAGARAPFFDQRDQVGQFALRFDVAGKGVGRLRRRARGLEHDEVRADLGKEPLTPEQKADLNPPPPPMLAGLGAEPDGDQPPAGGKKPGAAPAVDDKTKPEPPAAEPKA